MKSHHLYHWCFSKYRQGLLGPEDLRKKKVAESGSSHHQCPGALAFVIVLGSLLFFFSLLPCLYFTHSRLEVVGGGS